MSADVRYEPCVLGADGRCHRFSHTHPDEPEPFRVGDTCCGKCPVGTTCYVDQVTGA